MSLQAAKTWLFTPATRPERFAKAVSAGADVLIIDLEDAVAPADKDDARRAALDYLATKSPGGPQVALRVNALGTRSGLADLQALLASDAIPDILVLPKTEGPDQLRVLDALCAERRSAMRLVGLVESVRGLDTVDAIAAAAAPRLFGLMLGAADMAADLGAEPGWEPLLHARSRLVAACTSAGSVPIDSPFFALGDADGLQAEVKRTAALGFRAKAAIHPNQIDPIRAALTPTPDQVAQARAVLAETARGVGTVGGQMIDEAVARRARRTLAAAGLDQHEQE